MKKLLTFLLTVVLLFTSTFSYAFVLRAEDNVETGDTEQINEILNQDEGSETNGNSGQVVDPDGQNSSDQQIIEEQNDDATVVQEDEQNENTTGQILQESNNLSSFTMFGSPNIELKKPHDIWLFDEQVRENDKWYYVLDSIDSDYVEAITSVTAYEYNNKGELLNEYPVQYERHDDGKIYWDFVSYPLPGVHSRGYLVKIEAEGYEDYLAPHRMYGSKEDAPYGFIVTQDAEDNIVFYGDYYGGNFRSDNAGTVKFYRSSSSYALEDELGSIIATGEAGSGTLVATISAADMEFESQRYSMTISKATLLANNITPGSYELVFSCPTVVDFTAHLVYGKSANAGVLISSNNNQIIIECNDTDFLNALVSQNVVNYDDPSQNSNDSGYISAKLNNSASPTWSSAYGADLCNERIIEDDHTYEYIRYSIVDGKIVIPEDTIQNYKICSGNYTFNLHAPGYSNVSVTADITTSIRNYVPDDAEVYYDNKIGVVITSKDSNWLDAVLNGTVSINIDKFGGYQIYNNEGKIQMFRNNDKIIISNDVLSRQENYEDTEGVKDGEYYIIVRPENYINYISNWLANPLYIYLPTMHTVTFVYGNNIPNGEFRVADGGYIGDSIGSYQFPERSGYMIADMLSGNESFNGNVPITEDITLYAVWIKDLGLYAMYDNRKVNVILYSLEDDGTVWYSVDWDSINLEENQVDPAKFDAIYTKEGIRIAAQETPDYDDIILTGKYVDASDNNRNHIIWIKWLRFNGIEAYSHYSSQSNTINFEYWDKIDGYSIYMLDRIYDNNYDVANNLDYVVDGTTYQPNELQYKTEIINNQKVLTFTIGNRKFIVKQIQPEAFVTIEDVQYGFSNRFGFYDEQQHREIRILELNYHGEEVAVNRITINGALYYVDTLSYSGLAILGTRYEDPDINVTYYYAIAIAPETNVDSYVSVDGSTYPFNFSYMCLDEQGPLDVYHLSADPETQEKVSKVFIKIEGEYRAFDLETFSIGDSDYLMHGVNTTINDRRVCLVVYEENIHSDDKLQAVGLLNTGHVDEHGNPVYDEVRYRFSYQNIDGIDIYQTQGGYDTASLVGVVVFKDDQRIELETIKVSDLFEPGNYHRVGVYQDGDNTSYFVMNEASVFDRCDMSINGETIPMVVRNNNNKREWNFLYYTLTDSQKSKINNLYKSFKVMDIRFNFYLNSSDTNPALVLTSDNFTYGNFADYNYVHGYLATYTYKDGERTEKGYLAIERGQCLPQMNSIIDATFTFNGTVYHFDVDNPVEKNKTTKFNLLNAQNLDLDEVKEVNNNMITIRYKNVKNKEKTFNLHVGNTDYTNGYISIYASAYRTVNNDPDYKYEFCLGKQESGTITDYQTKDSLIIPTGVRFNSYLNNDNLGSAYGWQISVDPVAYSKLTGNESTGNGYTFRLKNIAQNNANIGIKEIIPDSNGYMSNVELLDSHTLSVTTTKWRDPSIIFAEISRDENNNIVYTNEQRHKFNLEADPDMVLEMSLLKDFSMVDTDDHGSINVNEISLNTDDSLRAVTFNLGTQNDLYPQFLSAIKKDDGTASELESRIVSFEFEKGVKVAKTYGVNSDGDGSENASVRMVLKKDNITQTITIIFRYNNDNYGGAVYINDNYCSARTIYHNKKEYKLFQTNNNNIPEDIVFEMTGYKYSKLYVKVVNEWLNNPYSNNGKVYTVYKDGTIYFVYNRTLMEIYNLDGIDIEASYNNPPHYNLAQREDWNGRRITVTENAYERQQEYGSYVTYSAALKRIGSLSQIAAYYDAEKDEYIAFTKTFSTYDEFKNYNGDEPAYFCLIKKVSDEERPYAIFMCTKTKYISENVVCRDHGNFDDDEDTNYLNVELNFNNIPEGYKDATDYFERVINSYVARQNVTVRFNSDLTLSRNIVLYHRNSQIVIDLNGHDLNAGNYSIDIANASQVYFANIKKNNAAGDSLIEYTGDKSLFNNYGCIYMNGNHYVEGVNTEYNKLTVNALNGTAVSTKVLGSYSVNVQLYNNVEINAKKGLVSTITSPEADGIYLSLSGSTINADEMGIYLETNTNNSSTNNICVRDNGVINSNKVGIYSNNIGTMNTQINVSNGSIEAKSPIIVTGTDVTVSENSRIVANMNYNSNYSYNLSYGQSGFSTNGDAITIDNKPNASRKVSVTVDSCRTLLLANGAAIAQTHTDAATAVDEIEISTYYLDGSEDRDSQDRIVSISRNIGQSNVNDMPRISFGSDLAKNVAKNLITVNGGYFDQNVSSYVDQSSNPIYPLKYLDQNNAVVKTGYAVYPTEYQSRDVRNYSELKTALNDPKVRWIYVQNDITYDSVNDDSSILTVNVGKYGKYINLINYATNAQYTISNYSFVVNGELERNQFNYELTINGGHIVNTDSYLQNLFTLNGARLDVQNADIDATNANAVRIISGRVHAYSGSYITGKSAIVIDVPETSATGFGFVEIYGSTIEGIGDSAIKVLNTNAEDWNSGSGIRCYSDWNTNANSHITTAANGKAAIEVNDYITGEIFNCEMSGTYGIYVYSDNGYWFNISEGTSITAIENAVYSRINDTATDRSSGVSVYNATLSAGRDLINVGETQNEYCYIEGGNFTKGEGYKYISYVYSNSGSGIRGGNFNAEVTEAEINNHSGDQYVYECLNTGSVAYPYAVLKNVKGNNAHANSYENITIANSRTVVIDNNQLNKAVSEAEVKANGTQNLIMIVEENNNANFGEGIKEGIKEYIDISIIKNNQQIDELTTYQVITFGISDATRKDEEGNDVPLYTDPEKLVLYHAHGDDEPVMIKKVVLDKDGEIPQEECYFITRDNAGKYYLNIVTRRFSTFGIAEMEETVAAEKEKTVVSLDLNYEESYDLDKFKEPANANVKGKDTTLSSAEAIIVYEGTGDTSWYSENELPRIGGTFKATWYISDDNSLHVSGCGSAEFELIDTSTAESTGGIGAVVHGRSISLNGVISLNFYVSMPGYNSNYNGYAVLTDGSKKVTLDINKCALGNDEYVFTYNLPAKEMDKLVSLRLYLDDGKLIALKDSDGNDCTTGCLTSISEYLMTVIEDMHSEPSYDLCETMSEYGDLANAFFSGREIDVSDRVNNVDAENLGDYRATEPENAKSIKEHSTSLILDSETTICHYFKVTDDIEYYEFYVGDGNSFIPVEAARAGENLYGLKITDISAKDLDKNYIVRVVYTDSKNVQHTYEYGYSALSYVYAQLNNAECPDNLRNLCKSLYLYNQEANAYFGS